MSKHLFIAERGPTVDSAHVLFEGRQECIMPETKEYVGVFAQSQNLWDNNRSIWYSRSLAAIFW